jgi:cytosine deaminase
MVDLLLKRGRIEGIGSLIDLAISDGHIVERGTGLAPASKHAIDLEGRLIVPGFVESHIHLDYCLTQPWDCPGRLASFRSQEELSRVAATSRESFTPEDIHARATAGIKLASRHGVTAMRAQCAVNTKIGLRNLDVLLSLREEHSDLIELQIVAHPNRGFVDDRAALRLLRQAAAAGADALGGSSNLDPMGRDNPKRFLDAVLDLAGELGVDLDVHADMELHDRIEVEDFEVVYLARRSLERGYQGRILAGHVSALGSTSIEDAREVALILREAGINIVSMPDLYRLGRADERNARRGLTRVACLLRNGVNVALASNNVRDALRPMGNFDLLEEGLILVYGAHMDTVDELRDVVRMCTENAAKAIGIVGYGLDEGCRADLVVLDAASAPAALVSQSEKRYVIRGGRVVSECLTRCIQPEHGSKNGCGALDAAQE